MRLVKQLSCGATAKASLNRAKLSLLSGSHGSDPKPGDLSMARVKLK